jgi:hypothetical protein
MNYSMNVRAWLDTLRDKLFGWVELRVILLGPEDTGIIFRPEGIEAIPVAAESWRHDGTLANVLMVSASLVAMRDAKENLTFELALERAARELGLSHELTEAFLDEIIGKALPAGAEHTA